MTLTEARQALTPPLMFGDEHQIEALEIISETNSARADLKLVFDELIECGMCGGAGVRKCCECRQELDCTSCNGEGSETLRSRISHLDIDTMKLDEIEKWLERVEDFAE